MLIGIMPLRM